NFKAICNFNEKIYQQGWYEINKLTMARGTGIIKTPQQAITYMAAYGSMHRYKLNLAFASLFGKENFNNKSAEIIDWGCGQALASCVLIDYIKYNKINLDLSNFILIEPSKISLQRGNAHINAIYQKKKKPQSHSVNEKADTELYIKRYQSISEIKIHLFSNLLDIDSLNLNQIFKNVTSNFEGLNYFVCISPINEIRLKTFYKMFSQSDLLSSNVSSIATEVFLPSAMRKITKSISSVEYIFKTDL
ncbi:MAG: hypothetical protein EBS86_14170, partial [Crocinitomicaceae bacterium]|nr:hypothetical protein [Crocinitomicaceae bacterium]